MATGTPSPIYVPTGKIMVPATTNVSVGCALTADWIDPSINIIVTNNGVDTPIETVSGGEFSRIQTAILLAIRSLLSKLGGSSINLLFLDEITGVLDEEGKEKLIEVLSEVVIFEDILSVVSAIKNDDNSKNSKILLNICIYMFL